MFSLNIIIISLSIFAWFVRTQKLSFLVCFFVLFVWGCYLFTWRSYFGSTIWNDRGCCCSCSVILTKYFKLFLLLFLTTTSYLLYDYFSWCRGLSSKRFEYQIICWICSLLHSLSPAFFNSEWTVCHKCVTQFIYFNFFYFLEENPLSWLVLLSLFIRLVLKLIKMKYSIKHMRQRTTTIYQWYRWIESIKSNRMASACKLFIFGSHFLIYCGQFIQ